MQILLQLPLATLDATLGGTGGGYLQLSTKGLASGQYVLSFYVGSDRSFFYTVKFEVKRAYRMERKRLACRRVSDVGFAQRAHCKRGRLRSSLALQSETRFMKCDREAPILCDCTESCLHRIIFNVLDHINKMLSVADIPVKWLVLPKLTPAVQQFIGFVRGVRFDRMRNVS